MPEMPQRTYSSPITAELLPTAAQERMARSFELQRQEQAAVTSAAQAQIFIRKQSTSENYERKVKRYVVLNFLLICRQKWMASKGYEDNLVTEGRILLFLQ